MTFNRGLSGTVMIAAFEGWNDAGEAASGLVDHLVEFWHGTELTELDPEQYYDFQVNRPTVTRQQSGRQIEWPTTHLYAATTGTGRSAILVHGIEPSMRWRAYCTELLGIASEFEVSSIVTVGALLADVPHTRPLPVTVSTSDPVIGELLSAEPSRYEGPTGIVGVLDAAASVSYGSASLWAAVPHYVAQPPVPKATLALVTKLEEVLGEPIPLGELTEDAQAWQTGADELASNDEEVARYVNHLERAQDTADLPEASGDAIAKEFEKYLRRRDNTSWDGP